LISSATSKKLVQRSEEDALKTIFTWLRPTKAAWLLFAHNVPP